MNRFFLALIIYITTCFSGLGQPISKGIGKADSSYIPFKMVRIGNKLFTIDIMANPDFSHYDLVAVKMDSTGKILNTKGFGTGNLNFADRRLFVVRNNLYFLGRINFQNRAIIIKLDTNMTVSKSILINEQLSRYSISDTASIIFMTSNSNNITAFDLDLNVIKSVNYRDSLNQKIIFKDINFQNGLVYVNFDSPSTVFDAVKAGMTTFDFALNEKRSRLFPNEAGSGSGGFWQRNEVPFAFLDSVRICSQLGYGSFENSYIKSIFNFQTDSIYFFRMKLPLNPSYDSLPVLQDYYDIYLNRIDSSGDFYYLYYRIYDTMEFRNEYFVGKINPLTGRIKNYRSKDVGIRPEIIGSPAEGKFSIWGSKNIATNFLGIGYFNQIDLDDTTNCLAFPDTFARMEWGPKFKMIPYRLVASDTTLSIQNFPLTEFAVKLCEFDFCNPPRYSGLGPDISTCADSVTLNGAIVYPGQKLEWSTGDTTLRIKVPVSAQPQTISIKISGICGTFEDTLVYSRSVAPAVSFNLPDSLLRCRSFSLNPVTTNWQNPVWQTPRGVRSGVTSLLADTSGTYIVQNGADNCAQRDTLYVEIRPTAHPNLLQPDTLRSCQPLVLTATGSPLVNLTWFTPQGQLSGISQLTANTTGQYRIVNEQLGCEKADSVFVRLRSPFAVQISPTADSLITCRSLLLNAQTTKPLGFFWGMPNGQISVQNPLRAQKTGWYTAQNDTANCLSRDSVHVTFRDTAQAEFILQAGGQRWLKLDTLIDENVLPLSLNAITQTQASLYRWYLDGRILPGNEFIQSFSLPDEGLYTLGLVTTSSDSCLASAEKRVQVRKRIFPAIFIPNLVTANNDGQNDFLEILQLPFYPDNELQVFNRWGREVFQASPYQNNWPAKEAETGTYFYRLSAGGKVFTGWVQVLK